jgi:hypothetical protein
MTTVPLKPGWQVPINDDVSRPVWPDQRRKTARRLEMIRWKARSARVALVLGALASLAIASGAGTRWA